PSVSPAPVSDEPRTSANGSPVLGDEGIAAAGGAPIPPWDGPSPDSYLPTLGGPIGLYRISTAEVGPTNHLRLALHGEFFQSSSFLVAKAPDRRLLGDFTFGYPVHRNVELFGALLTASNRNTRANETDRRDPELIKSFGDLVLGAKGQMPLAR